MSIIGDISIAMGVNTGGLKKGLGDARGQVGGFASGLGSLAGTLGSAGQGLGDLAGHVFSVKGAVAGLAGLLTGGTLVAGLKSMVSGSLESIDAAHDQADQIGTTTAALMKLQYATQLTGSEASDLGPALQKMNANLSDAARVGGPAADALTRMGLDAKTLVKMDPTEAFKAISGGFDSLQNPADKAATAMDVFGKSGMSLLNTLGAGPEALAALEAESKKLGGSLSEMDIAKVDAAKASLDRAGTAIGGIGNQLAVQLAPYITTAVDAFTNFASTGLHASDLITGGIDLVESALGGLADAVSWLKTGFLGLQVVVSGAFTLMLTEAVKFAEGLESVINLIPGMHVEFSATLRTMATDMAKLTGDQAKRFREDMAKPPPSEKIKQFFGDLKTGADAAARAIAEAARKTPALGDSFAEVAEKIVELTKKLKEQIVTFGLSGAAAEIASLKGKHATAEQLAGVQALADRLAKMEEGKKKVDELKTEAKSLKDEVRSPLDKFRDDLTKLQDMFAHGLIGKDVLDKGVLKARGEMEKDRGPTKFAGALELGSKEARTSVLAAQGMRAGDDPLKSVAKTGLDSLTEERRHTTLLQQAVALLTTGQSNTLSLPGAG